MHLLAAELCFQYSLTKILRYNMRISLSRNGHSQILHVTFLLFLKHDIHLTEGNTAEFWDCAFTRFCCPLRLCHHQRRSTPSSHLWRAAVKITDLKVTAAITFCPQAKSATTGGTATSLSFCSWMLYQLSPVEDSNISESVLNGGTLHWMNTVLLRFSSSSLN